MLKNNITNNITEQDAQRGELADRVAMLEGELRSKTQQYEDEVILHYYTSTLVILQYYSITVFSEKFVPPKGDTLFCVKMVPEGGKQQAGPGGKSFSTYGGF